MGREAAARRSRVALEACFVAIALLAIGCHTFGSDTANEGQRPIALRDAAEAAATPHRGGRLVVAVPEETNGWNPFKNQWGDAPTLIGTSMVEPLAVQENDGTAVPWLAEHWEPNADFTQWDISLRPGVVFHDNTPFNAEAAKKSLDKMHKSSYYSIQYGPLYDHVEVVDEMTVRVFLKLRWAAYPISLAYAWMLAPSMLDQPDEGVLHPIGTGPFRFQEWSQFKSLSAVRWDKYWRKDPAGQPLPYLDELEFQILTETATRAQALRSGDIDLALSTQAEMLVGLPDDYNVVKDYNTQRTYLMLNTVGGPGTRNNPFHNEHARRALAYAIDRERIAAKIGPDIGSTTYGYRPDSPWAPAGSDGYVDHDPAAARRELDLYKKETGAKSLSFTLNAASNVDVQRTVQDLKADLAEFGIEVQGSTVDQPKAGLVAALGDFHATLVRTHDFPDPDQMSFYYSSSSLAPVGEVSLNLTRYTSPTLDANLKIVRESSDPAARKAANDEIIRETNGAVIDVWLYDTPESIVTTPHVKGLDGFRSHAFANPLPKPWLAETWVT